MLPCELICRRYLMDVDACWGGGDMTTLGSADRRIVVRRWKGGPLFGTIAGCLSADEEACGAGDLSCATFFSTGAFLA